VAEPDPTLVAIADDLYALAPEEFTEARDGRAKKARGEGQLDVANVIKSWRRPKTSAWLLNTLARERTDRLGELFRLDAGLRDAQQRGHGKQMRALSRQRRELVNGLVSEASGLAETADHRISENVVREVETTLHAALTDPRAADAVSTGRLLTPLSPNGFDPVDLDGAVVLPAESAPGGPVPVLPNPEAAGQGVAERPTGDRSRVNEARAAVRDAAAAAAEAEQSLSASDQKVQSAAANLDELRSRVAELEAALDQARAAATDGGGELRTARRERDAADRDVQAARRRLAAAESVLERLER
jgi:hypothetical protein